MRYNRFNKLLSYRNKYFDLGGDTTDNLLNFLQGIGKLDSTPTVSNYYQNLPDYTYKEQHTLNGITLPLTGDELIAKTNPVASAHTPTKNEDKIKNFLNDNSILLNTASTVVGGMLGGEYKSGIGSTAESLSKLTSLIPGPFGTAATTALNIAGGLSNRLLGSSMNQENINNVEQNINRLNNFQADANSFDSLSDLWSDTQMGFDFNNSYIGKDGVFGNKASKKANELRDKMRYATDYAQRALVLNNDNLIQNNMNNLNANYKAYGGGLDTNGMSIPTGIDMINNGGTHEENPYGGIPYGMDSQGNQNLIEQGEAIYNDYVFSNRLTVPKEVRKKYNLKGKKDLTFADAMNQLSKQLEERPNDNINKESVEEKIYGLQQIQELMKNQIEQNQFACGGKVRKLKEGGSKENIPIGMQRLNMNNSTTGLTFGDPNFNPYNADGTIDFNKMYNEKSPFMIRRKYVLDHWDEPQIQTWLDKYINGINEYNKNRTGYTPMQKKDVTKEIFKERTQDKNWGAMHAGIDLAGDPSIQNKTRYWLRQGNGKDAVLIEGVPENPDALQENGYNWWQNTNKGDYKFINQVKRDPVDGVIYTDRYYDAPIKEDEKDKREDLLDKNVKLKEERYRYAPAIGLGMAALQDALGITNKQDYSGIASLEASMNRGNYKPVSFTPLGNYLKYQALDRDYYTNKLNAQSAATRADILSQSNGNRNTAINGLLTADYNAQNSLGDLFRKTEESNYDRYLKTEEFNRATNQANSSGMLQADTANQSAYNNLRSSHLSGLMSAYELRQKEKQASDAAKSANLSGFLNALGDIGYENKSLNMVRGLYASGYLAPINEQARISWDLTDNPEKGKYNILNLFRV